MGTLVVNKKGRKRIQSGHPWVFASDILEARDVAPGDVTEVFSQEQQLLG